MYARSVRRSLAFASVVAAFAVFAAVSRGWSGEDADREQANELARKGLDAERAGDYRKAVGFYRDAQKRLPDEPRLRYRTGACLIKLNESKEAAKELRAFVRAGAEGHKLDAEEVDYARSWLDELLLPKLTAGQRKRLQDAEDHLEVQKRLIDAAIDDESADRTPARKAVEVLIGLSREEPGYLPLYPRLGSAYERLKDYENATRAYERYLTGHEKLGYPPGDLRDVRIRRDLNDSLSLGALLREGDAAFDRGDMALAEEKYRNYAGRRGDLDVRKKLDYAAWYNRTPAVRAFDGKHDGYAWKLAASPDGRWVVSYRVDGKPQEAWLWSAESGEKVEGGKKVARFLKPNLKHDPQVYPLQTVSFSPDGQRILFAYHDGALWLHEFKPDLHRFAPRRRFRGSPSRAPLFGATFGTDGSTVYSLDDQNLVVQWDATTGEAVRSYFADHPELTKPEPGNPQGRANRIIGLAKDGSRAVSTPDNRALHVWELASGRLLSRVALPRGHLFKACVFTSNCAQAALQLCLEPSRPGGEPVWLGEIDVYNLDTGERRVINAEPKPALHSLAVSADGRRVLLGRETGYIDLFQVDNHRLVGTFGEGPLAEDTDGDGRVDKTTARNPVACVIFTPDGRSALSSTKSIRLWRLPPETSQDRR
jgi:WD40 repeat protein